MRAIRLHANRAEDKAIWAGIVLCALYVGALAGSLALTPHTALPPFWPSNAFIAAAVILLPRRVLWWCVAICALVSLPLMYPHASNGAFATMRVILNIGEGLVAGGLARRVLGPRRLLRTAMMFTRLQLFAILPAAALNWLAREITLRLMSDHAVVEAWRSAFLPHLLGMATVLPAILLFAQPSVTTARRPRLEAGMFFAALAVIVYFVFAKIHFPVTFLISPLLILAAFRLGPRGAVFGNLLAALFFLPGTINGAGAFSLHPQWTLADRALIYQGVILSSLFGISICSFTVAEQARLRRLLLRRATAARDARLRAMTASRAKTDFLATMSHEIRTPMNSILGFTQLLLVEKDLPAQVRDRLRIIADASGSLMTVLNDILDFSRVEAGQIELHLEPVDVADVAAGAVEIMRAPARAKGLALRLETEGLEGRFEGDGQRLRQVLLNLMNNAVKFTEEGHVLLRATCDGERGVLRFEISDTGIGIGEEALGRLFSRFSQADSSTTRQYGGSGLGLAICKGLVERMGGGIGVESRPGAGSTFWFETPARPVAPALALAETSQEEPARLGGRVLLVDDHPMNRLLGETLLGILGCAVDLAGSGEEAVQAAREQAYDVILMDVHMPGMDGLAAARAIKAGYPKGEGPRVIAMSADVMPQNLERCRQAGMVDHIAKPVQMPQMQRVLGRWIAEQKTRSAA